MTTLKSINRNAGFTLVEMVVSIVITGIIAGMVAVFIRSPVQGYMDAQRRAELTDVADTAVRRIARDIRAALPNSVRTSADGSGSCIEFMPTKIGARYRAEKNTFNGATTGYGDPLEFTLSDTGGGDESFDMLWPYTPNVLPSSLIEVGDVVVVYNDGSEGNAYSGNNAIKVEKVAVSTFGANSTNITFDKTGSAAPFELKKLPSASPYYRFQVIPGNSHVVSYICTTGRQLIRTTRVLAAAWDRPANCEKMAEGATTTAVLANKVDSCILTYDAPGVSTGLSRFGIVLMSMAISDSGETVNLYHQVHVDNTP